MKLLKFEKRNFRDKTHNIIIDCAIELSNGDKRLIDITTVEENIEDSGEEKIKNEILSSPESEFSEDIMYERFYADSQGIIDGLKKWRQSG